MEFCKEHGKLHVEGTQLMDSGNAPVRLCGVSAYWLTPYKQLLNIDAFRTLRDDWKANCIRFPIPTFIYYRDVAIEENENLLMQAVEDATSLGMYVIIDWHVLGEQNPLVSLEKAETFFEKFSKMYADRSNILYEICNEPNREGGSWENITEYANRIIPVIRKNSPDAVIMVGTPCWSQWVDVAADAPLNFDNLMYSLHFYGATHRHELRSKLTYAHEKGLPVFVNEFGLCSASGNGEIDVYEAGEWKRLLDEYNISYICWNLSTCNEASSILKHTCEHVSNWDDDDLSVQGKIVRSWMRGDAPGKVKWGVLGTARIAAGCAIPGIMKAENAVLYAIAGRSAEKVQDFKERFGFEKSYVGYEKLLEDKEVQAVYIPLTNDLHKEWVIKALKAGKHVLCEKPMALNADDAREMYAVAKENNVLLMEAYAYLHSNYMKSLINDIRDGAIGDIVYIDTAFLTQGYNSDFRLWKNLGGGMIYDLGCYCTTMILSLVNSNVEYARAVAEKNEDGVDSFTASIVKFENGVRASFDVGMILGNDSNARYDRLFIHGTKGDIKSEAEYNGQGELSYRIVSNGTVTEKKVIVPSNYMLEVSQFSSCILLGNTPHVSEEFSVKNAELIDMLLKSIKF